MVGPLARNGVGRFDRDSLCVIRVDSRTFAVQKSRYWVPACAGMTARCTGRLMHSARLGYCHSICPTVDLIATALVLRCAHLGFRRVRHTHFVRATRWRWGRGSAEAVFHRGEPGGGGRGKWLGLWSGTAWDDLTRIRFALFAWIRVDSRFQNRVAGFPRARE